MVAVSIIPLLLFLLAMIVFGGSPSEIGKKIKGENGIAIVDISGEIFESEKFRRALERAVDDEKVKGIVVRIDSPGGAVGASEEIHSLIKSADTKKPVVCSLQSLAASGGLYSAVGCRKIIAHAGTLTGSIGVIMTAPEFPSLLQRFGVSMNVIKSGKLKDVGSPFRSMTDDDRNYLQSMIDRAYEQFVNVVATSRGIPVEEVRKFADGRVLLGEDAVKLKLADEIGGVERAAEVALEAAGLKGEPELVYPPKKSGFQQMLDPEEWTFVKFLSSVSNGQLLYRAFL